MMMRRRRKEVAWCQHGIVREFWLSERAFQSGRKKKRFLQKSWQDHVESSRYVITLQLSASLKLSNVFTYTHSIHKNGKKLTYTHSNNKKMQLWTITTTKKSSAFERETESRSFVWVIRGVRAEEVMVKLEPFLVSWFVFQTETPWWYNISKIPRLPA